MDSRQLIKQIMVPLDRKGAHDDGDEFRGIILWSISGEALCRVIQRSLVERVDRVVRENQCSFPKLCIQVCGPSMHSQDGAKRKRHGDLHTQ